MEGVKVRRLAPPEPWMLRNNDPMVAPSDLEEPQLFPAGGVLFRFLLLFVIGGGWMDGVAGMHYCFMIAMYEYWIELEDQRAGGGLAKNAPIKLVARLLADTQSRSSSSPDLNNADASAPPEAWARQSRRRRGGGDDPNAQRGGSHRRRR